MKYQINVRPLTSKSSLGISVQKSGEKVVIVGLTIRQFSISDNTISNGIRLIDFEAPRSIVSGFSTSTFTKTPGRLLIDLRPIRIIIDRSHAVRK